MSGDIVRRLNRLEREAQVRPDRLGTDAGTWTPFFVGSSTAGTFTYVTQTGIYRQLGDTVFFWIELSISAIPVAPTGNMRINLHTTSAAGMNYACALGAVSQLDYPAGMLELTAFVEGGQSYIVLAYTRDNQATVAYPATSFTNVDTLLRISGSYLV
jgi:hypothetical protein